MEKSLNLALKKAKRKQLLKTILISVIVVMISIPVLYKIGNYFAAQSSNRLHERLFLHNTIAEPNIAIDSQVTSSSSMFGGNIITNRSKNINGYRVQWSSITSSYDWFRVDMGTNEMIPGFHWSDTDIYEYDKQTKNKVATFYHPSVKTYYDGVKNDLAGISEMENHVAEVAVSFDRPYSFQEIQSKIPDNLNIVWLYMTSQVTDESTAPSGVTVYGFDPHNSPVESYDSFLKGLKEYDVNGDNETIQDYVDANEGKTFEEVKVLGVMLTGRAENFEPLRNAGFIRGASAGVTAEVVPYIKLEK
ncbi:MAG: sigma factor regulator N-terminal domain-containing protein [Bacillus sp. (in: firmicutes)]